MVGVGLEGGAPALEPGCELGGRRRRKEEEAGPVAREDRGWPGAGPMEGEEGSLAVRTAGGGGVESPGRSLWLGRCDHWGWEWSRGDLRISPFPGASGGGLLR